MSVNMYILIVSIVIGCVVAAEKLDGRNEGTKIQKSDQIVSYLDILTKELLSQSWEDNTLCLEQIIYTINNAKNATLWATWVWDSTQLPTGQLYGSRYHLGNYDQCLREKVGSSRLPYLTQYCLANILLQNKTVNVSPDTIDPYGSADDYVQSMTVLDQRFNEMSWGLCVPRVCKSKSVERFARALLKLSHLGYLQSPDKITINCEFPKDATVNGSTVFFTFMLLTSLIVVACTICVRVIGRENPSSYAQAVIQCFCLKRNLKEFLQMPKNDVKVLHGMRTISCVSIVLSHIVFLMHTMTTANGLDFEEDIHSYGQNIMQLVVVVDTFFLMSGLLFMRNIKRNCTIQDLVDSLIKRYFRLIWWYIANVMIIFFVLPNSGCGPLCSKYVNTERENCHRTWWSGLLMIANYHNVCSVCVSFSWYILCDFQISVVCSVIFWIYQRHKRVGATCLILLTILSVTLNGYYAYYDEEFIIKYDMYEKFRDSRRSITMMHLYSKTHFRANPYLIGVMMGYLMSNYEAEDIRNYFIKKRIIMGFLGYSLIVVVILVAYVNGDSALKNALFLSLHRPLWALLMCILIGVCEYGSFPIVKDVLSWNVFVPLSKLTYGIYMTHFTTIAANLVCTRSPLHYNVGILIEKLLAHLTLTTLISFIFLLFVESPLNNVVKMVLANRRNNNVNTSGVRNGGDVVIQNGGTETKTTIPNVDISQFDLKEKQL